MQQAAGLVQQSLPFTCLCLAEQRQAAAVFLFQPSIPDAKILQQPYGVVQQLGRGEGTVAAEEQALFSPLPWIGDVVGREHAQPQNGAEPVAAILPHGLQLLLQGAPGRDSVIERLQGIRP